MPDFSIQNDLSMPAFDWGSCSGPPPGKREPLSEEERKKACRCFLKIGAFLCLIFPPLIPFGLSVAAFCAAAGAMRLFGEFLNSGLLEEWLGRFFRFAWSGAVRSARWMVLSVREIWAARRNGDLLSEGVFRHLAVQQPLVMQLDHNILK